MKQEGADVMEFREWGQDEWSSVVDKDGWLPLHWAVENQAGAEVV
eukprot:COSAG05_NODE_24092_length_254_cov_0.387097_1_plen_44_part_01